MKILLQKGNPYFKAIIVSFLFLAFLIAPSLIASNYYYQQHLIKQSRNEIEHELSPYTLSLEKEIFTRAALLSGVEAFTISNYNKMNQENFKIFASGLMASSEGVRNVIVAPNGINTYVYPIETNETAIGHNQLTDEREDVRKSVLSAIETQELIASGPYELRQGGTGLVFKKAVFIDQEFYGLISEVIDMQSVFEIANLEIASSKFKLAVYKDDLLLYGNPIINIDEPIIQYIQLPQGAITIKAAPNDNWISSIQQQKKHFLLIAILISSLLLLIIYILAYRNQKLNYEINSRTKQLQDIDVSLRKKLRLESIGTLAGGVAHEINNPINGIINYSQLLIDDNEIKEDAKKYVREIIHESNRIVKVVNSLQNSVDNKPQHITKIQPSTLWEQTNSLIKTLLLDNQIQMTVSIDNDLPKMQCDTKQIQQVFISLIRNAVDSLNEKYTGYHINKRIIVEISQVERLDGLFIIYSFKDFGNGIDAIIQDKIFTPFFSTKNKADHSGLGLFVFAGIIKEHNGKIYFTSDKNISTTFYVEIPIID